LYAITGRWEVRAATGQFAGMMGPGTSSFESGGRQGGFTASYASLDD